MTTLPIDNHVVIPEYLLAIDAGVKTGLALFSRPDKLIWYRSHNMGSVNGLRKAAYNLIHSIENLTCIAVEGGGPVAVAWIKEAGKQNIKIISTDAGEWRKQLLFSADQSSKTPKHLRGTPLPMMQQKPFLLDTGPVNLLAG
jgi:hypothetical protein